MKRLMPSSLIDFLANNPNCIKADCFAIQLPTGATLCTTEGQWDITLAPLTPGWAGSQTTFKATQYGVWSRGKITSTASTSCSSNTMDLTCVPQPSTTYPGVPLGILNAALNHLFDAAIVWVYTVYMPLNGYGDVSAGVETKFQGTITRTPKLSRNMVQFECADPMYLLNMKVPSRLMQSNCPWSFCDVNCTLNAEDYTIQFSAAGPGSSTLSSSSLTQPDGYFAQGVVTCLTGENAGLSQTVKQHAAGVLTLTVPWLLPVRTGDTFSVIKGCDKTPGTCASTAQADGTPEPKDYRVRFGGTPFVPAPSSSI